MNKDWSLTPKGKSFYNIMKFNSTPKPLWLTEMNTHKGFERIANISKDIIIYFIHEDLIKYIYQLVCWSWKQLIIV